MLRRSALGAVAAGNGSLGATTRRIAEQHRTFTATALRCAVPQITHFTPTSSESLDELLSTIRAKIFLPAFLNLEQRKRLYSAKHEKRLEIDPIIIEIDGEINKLRHLSFKRDEIPNTRKSVLLALRQFDTPRDFANLRPLLEGVKQTGFNMGPQFYPQVARLVAAKGHVYKVVELARGVKLTGFKLDESERVNVILHFVQRKYIDMAGAARRAQLRQALQQCNMVIDMLSEADHQPRRPVEGALPLARDPQVLLARLHLAAVLVSKYPNSGTRESQTDDLLEYCRDVVRLWPADKKLEELPRDPAHMAYLMGSNKRVAYFAPLLHGLETARAFIQDRDPELAGQLGVRAEGLRAGVEADLLTIPEDKLWGRDVYTRLFGQETTTEEEELPEVSPAAAA